MMFFDRSIIPALWIAWLLYWAIAAAGAKVTRRSESRRERLGYIIPLLLGGILLAVPNRMGPLDGRMLPFSMTLFWIAVALVAAGLAFTVAARIRIGRNWSGNVTLKVDHELVCTGPYGIVRHPIYSGLLLAILGSALAVDEWRALLALALFIWSFVRKIAIEERFMSEQFRVVHARYAAQVPALIPFVY